MTAIADGDAKATLDWLNQSHHQPPSMNAVDLNMAVGRANSILDIITHSNDFVREADECVTNKSLSQCKKCELGILNREENSMKFNAILLSHRVEAMLQIS